MPFKEIPKDALAHSQYPGNFQFTGKMWLTCSSSNTCWCWIIPVRKVLSSLVSLWSACSNLYVAVPQNRRPVHERVQSLHSFLQQFVVGLVSPFSVIDIGVIYTLS